MNDRMPMEWLAIALLSLMAGLSAFLATPLGPGVSPDSTIYLATARGIAHGRGWVSPTEADATVIPMTHYPPLYPLALAAGKRLHLSPLGTARLINATTFGATVFLAEVLTQLSVGGRIAAIVAAFLVSTSANVFSVFTFVYSEPMAMALGVATLISLIRYLKQPTTFALLTSAVFASTGCLTRYAGVALVLAGSVTLVRYGKRKWIDASIFGAIALMPLVGWLIRNRLVAGTLASRQIEWHVGSMLQWISFCRTFYTSVAPTETVVISLAVGACLMLLGWTGAIERSGWNLRFSPGSILLGFCLAFHLMLVSVVVEPGRPLDSRLLAPMFVPAVVLAVHFFSLLVRRARRQTIAIPAASLAVILLVVSNGAAMISFARAARTSGLGMNKLRWRESAVLSAINQRGRKIEMLSNAPDGMLFIDSLAGGWRYDDGRSLHVRLLPPSVGLIPQMLPRGGWICYAPGVTRISVSSDELRELPGIHRRMRDQQGFILYTFEPLAGTHH